MNNAMSRGFGRFFATALLCLLATAAEAAPPPGTISGYVKDAAGKPQMGAMIEIFTSAASLPLRAYSDDKGFYLAANLLPGNYYIKATANSFLPSLRENVSLRAGTHLIINLTLNTLFEAVQLAPAVKRTSKDDDDWRWTLRSTSNRPILRVLDDGPLVVVSKSDGPGDRALKARVAFIAGSDGNGFSGSDMKTSFAVEESIFSSGTMSFAGNVGYSAGQANGTVRATYKHRFANGAHPQFSITARRLATADTALQHAALSALALSMEDGFNVADFLDVNYGGELQSIQFRGRVNAFRPFGSVAAHLSPNTLLEYSYATSQPTTRAAKGYDSAPADLTESNPRVSLQNDAARLERAGHHEISLSQRLGKNSLQAAYYHDRLSNAAVTGVGDVDASSGDLLPDVYSNTFTYTGGNLEAQGLRLVAERKFSSALTATLNYSFGGALVVRGENLTLDGSTPLFRAQNRNSITSKFAGELPLTRTRWITSYKWTSGHGVVTAVDMFNAGAGQSDPYLNVFLRQPIPGASFLPGKMEALVDVRNLLSQGYIPMMGGDGHTLYLVQTARAIRGGLAFNF